MGKRGRPRKNGAKPGWMFGRALVILYEYDKARAKQKYTAAIEAAISGVRAWWPEMRVSATEVKRVLAEFRSKQLRTTILRVYRELVGAEADEYLRRLTELEKLCGLPAQLRSAKSEPPRVRILEIRMGPNPDYPRHNAKPERRNL